MCLKIVILNNIKHVNVLKEQNRIKIALIISIIYTWGIIFMVATSLSVRNHGHHGVNLCHSEMLLSKNRLFDDRTCHLSL